MIAVLPGLEGYAGRSLALGQWDTDPTLARAFVRWCGVRQGSLIVEPSCGIGNVAIEAQRAGAHVLGIEFDGARAALAIERGVRVVVGDVHEPAAADAVERWRASHGRALPCAIGNPPFEANGALLHPLRWLDFACRACWIAPLETLAGATRIDLWGRLWLRRVAVCRSAVGSRPPFGEGGNGMSEIAFFDAESASGRDPFEITEARLTWCDWRALGAPSP